MGKNVDGVSIESNSDDEDALATVKESIQQSWIDAMNGEIYPIYTLWNDLDADES